MVGSTIKTRSGIYFDLMDPTEDMVDIHDIAAALSKICRFGGHSCGFYSVAEHCVLATEQAERDGRGRMQCAAILLHDAAEAYCGDVVKPLKREVGEAYAKIEQGIERAIERKFGVDLLGSRSKEIIKSYDRRMLATEKAQLFSPVSGEPEWPGLAYVRPINIPVGFLDPPLAEEVYLETFERLRV